MKLIQSLNTPLGISSGVSFKLNWASDASSLLSGLGGLSGSYGIAGLIPGINNINFNKSRGDAYGAMLRQIQEQNWENERIRGWQSSENQLNRAFTERMQEDAQSFNRYEAQKARQFERDFWKEQFDAENAYNTPEAQMQRLIQAGINPAAVFGQGTNSSAMGASPSASPSSSSQSSFGSAPSGSSAGSTGAGSYSQPSYPNFASDLKSLADAFGSVARAGLDKANEKATLGKLQGEIDNMMADTKYKEAMSSYTNVQKQMADAKVPYAARLAAAEYVGQLLKNNSEAADAALKRAEGILADEKSSRLRLEWPILQENLKRTGQLILEQQKTEKTKQQENVASAEKMSAETKTENDTRASKVVLSNAQAAIADAQAAVDSNPSIIQKKLDAVGKALDLDVVKSSADYQEMQRKYNYLKDLNNTRKSIPARLLDDYLTYLTTTLGNVLSGMGAAAIK